jgi:hypothetical protein
MKKFFLSKKIVGSGLVNLAGNITYYRVDIRTGRLPPHNENSVRRE